MNTRSAGGAWLIGWRPYPLLVALCLCLYLPGQAALPVLDRDEARFAQASRQMLESGDFLDIRFRDGPRNNKPAGVYWLQAAAVAAFSDPHSTAIWPYRLPSLIGAVAAVLLVFGLGRALLAAGDPAAAAPTAFVAAALLGCALATIAEAHIAKTDAALLAATTAAQGALGLCYVRARTGAGVGRGVAAVFWLGEIAAIYLKGPIGPGLALATGTTLWLADRDAQWLRDLRPFVGGAAALLAVAPWLYAIQHATQGQFLAGSVGHDFWAKIVGAREAHGAPPLYYLVLAMVTFWPGSLALVPALQRGWQNCGNPASRFLLAWLVPAWVVLELVPTKLPHYALPLYPALALLAAAAMSESAAAEGLIARLLRIVARVVWAAVTLGLAAALIALPVAFGTGAVWPSITGAAAVAALVGVSLCRRHCPIGTVALLAGLAVALIVPAALVVPSLDRLWLSRTAAALIARHPAAAGAPPVVIGYNEPSLVFLLDGRLRTATADAAATEAGGMALVEERQTPVFERTLAQRGLAAMAVDSVSGTDYSNGQRMVLTLYRIEKR